MVARKPPPASKRSEKSLEIGVARYPHFKKHISSDRSVTFDDIKAIAAETGMQYRAVRKLALAFQQDRRPETLAPKPRGSSPGTSRTDPDILTAIGDLIQKIAVQPVPPNRAEAARQIWGLLHADNGEYRFAEEMLPSERTIQRRIGQIASVEFAKTMGSKSRSANELHPGEYRSEGFLDLVQMDHTRANVILVDRFRREALGRPWLTLVIDIWTRCIIGYYVSFGDPSIFRCGRAVASAILPKQAVLDHYGLDIAYPMYGQFKRLHTDQAKPHNAAAFKRGCGVAGINPDIREPGPAHHGGHIERLIGTVLGKIRLLPGKTGENVTARDGYDAEAEAVMTLHEFERWLLCQIAIYHNTPHDGLGRQCPAQVWQFEAANHGPLLDLSLEPEQLFREFLPTKSLTVHSSGVVRSYRWYSHPDIANWIGMKVDVSYDERSIQSVFVKSGDKFLELPATSEYPEVWEADWEAHRKRTRDKGRSFHHAHRAETSRAIATANQQIHASTKLTKEARRQAMRREGEGITVADLQIRELPKKTKVEWKPVADLAKDDWPVVR